MSDRHPDPMLNPLLELLEGCLEGSASCLLVDCGSRSRSVAFLAATSASAHERGDALLCRRLSPDEARCETALYSGLRGDLRELALKLAPTATERFLASEALSVCAGERTLESVSYETRERLDALKVYDCWTPEDELAGALKVLAELALRQGQRVIFFYQEAQLLEERGLFFLLEGFEQATRDSSHLLLVLSGSAPLSVDMARAGLGMSFREATLKP